MTIDPSDIKLVDIKSSLTDTVLAGTSVELKIDFRELICQQHDILKVREASKRLYAEIDKSVNYYLAYNREATYETIDLHIKASDNGKLTLYISNKVKPIVIETDHPKFINFSQGPKNESTKQHKRHRFNGSQGGSAWKRPGPPT